MFDPATLAGLGLLGLFVAAFLAGSVLPLASEGVLVAVLVAGVHPLVAVLVATAGNVLGAFTIYMMGYALARGRARWRWPRFLERAAGDEARRDRARERIRRYGAPALLLSWVPIVGDVLVLGAGLIGIRFAWFAILVTLGKGGRYAIVAWLTMASGL